MTVSLEIDDEVATLLQAVRLRTGLTFEEIFSRALAFLDWALNRRSAGLIIATLNQETRVYREVDMEQLLKPAATAARSDAAA